MSFAADATVEIVKKIDVLPKIAIQDHLFFLYKNLQTNHHTIMAGC